MKQANQGAYLPCPIGTAAAARRRRQATLTYALSGRSSVLLWLAARTGRIAYRKGKGSCNGLLRECVCRWTYIYVCMYTLCVCMHVCMYVYMYVCIYVCMYVYSYVCMYVYIYMYVCMHCVYVCMYACMYVCMYVPSPSNSNIRKFGLLFL